VLSSTADLIAQAVASGTGIAAFNVITIEHIEAVATASECTGLPAIVQISHNAVRYHHDLTPLAAAATAVAAASTARLSLHLDHVEEPELLYRTAACGASSVMFDASRLPDEQNIAATRAAADWAHRHGLFIEAELGEIGGKGSAHTPGVRTDPDQAADFVAATGVDALAVAVGTSHAMRTRTAQLDLPLIARLRDAVPVPLVLHGSSGIPNAMLGEAVAHGMTKINIGTLLNIAFTDSIRTALREDPSVVDPRRYLTTAREAATAVIADCLKTIGTGQTTPTFRLPRSGQPGAARRSPLTSPDYPSVTRSAPDHRRRVNSIGKLNS
jgi:fructose-bisphosphate aldolase class II